MGLLVHVPRQRPILCGPCLRASKRIPIAQKRTRTEGPSAEMQEYWSKQAARIKAGAQKSMLSVLEERGLVKDIAGGREALDYVLTAKPVGVYVGVDPTAPSLHVGHLLPLMVLYWMYLYGFPAVSLLGTATVDIGDPSGRTSARTPQAQAAKRYNIRGMKDQMKHLWRHVNGLGVRHGFPPQTPRERYLLLNHEWHQHVSALELIGTLGSGMRLGAMLNRDSVQARLETGNGMALSEFCYPLFQGYDWWRMFQQLHIQIQVGGSDQYGNICAGIEAVDTMRKAKNADVNLKDPLRGPYGLTTPLLTTASGEKFGKSAGNAVWLDPEMLSSYDLYKYILGTADDDVERYLKLFTFLPIEKISMVMQAQRIDPSKRIAHHLLAKEVVELAHGAMKAKDAEQGHKHAFSFGANNYNLQVLRTKLATAANEDGPEESMGRHARDIEYMQYKKQFALAAGGTFPAPTATKPTTTKDNMITLPHTFIMDCTFPQLLYATGMVSSKSEAQRLIQSKGAYVVLPNSGAQETPFNLLWDKIADGALPKNYLVDFEALVLRTGKTNMRICRIVKTEDFEAKGLDFPGWEDFKARKGKSNLEETLKSSAVLEKPTQ